MTCVQDVKPVSGVPTIHLVPPDVHSLDAATEAIELGECYGLTLDPDQQTTIRGALGERRDGSWAAGEVVDHEGRQAGKNDTALLRKLAGVELFGERLILHTAHEFQTANEDFLRLVAIFEAFDDLRKKVARIRYANGEQGIEYVNGARIKYKARTGGAGRGYAEADVVFYDEDQHLQAEHLGASLPTMLVNPNFQAWFCGSGALSTSTQSHALRRRAILGIAGVADPGRLAYTENTAQSVNVVNGEIVLLSPAIEQMLDEDVLWSHPGYRNGRVSREAMETMFRSLGPDLFGREILNIPDPEPGEYGGVIDLALWLSLIESTSSIAFNKSWALAVSPDRQWATFGVAGRRADGRLHVEWLERKAGTSWVVDTGVDLYERSWIPLRIHKSGPEGSFIVPLRERGVEVVEVSSAEVTAATGQFIDACNGGQLRHLGQASLDIALKGAVLRTSSDGAALWSQRNSSTEITALMACTVAAGGVPSEDIDPQVF